MARRGPPGTPPSARPKRPDRDRALLLFGFSGAFRRSELVALRVEDLTETPDGLRVRIRHSKTDQEGVGQEIAIPRGTRLRPVEALRAWLAAAGITEGPVFRRVTRHGVVLSDALAAESVADIVKHYAARAGLDPNVYAGHSLRAGFLTSGAEAAPQSSSSWKSAGTRAWTRCAATSGGPSCSRTMRGPASSDRRTLVLAHRATVARPPAERGPYGPRRPRPGPGGPGRTRRRGGPAYPASPRAKQAR